MFLARTVTNVLVYCFPLAVAATSLLDGQVESPSNGVRVAVAALAKQPPRLDGTLNDPIWGTAPAVTDFRQREPLETQPATEKTEVHILYDSRHVYFGVHRYDHDPKAIIATQLRQDLSQDLDDNFAIVIDPTLSHRSALLKKVIQFLANHSRISGI
jgi:hypothetical protein